MTALYGLIVTTTGWTLREVDDLTMHDVHPLLDYWADFPPVHVLLRGFFGASGGGETFVPSSEDELRAAMAMGA